MKDESEFSFDNLEKIDASNFDFLFEMDNRRKELIYLSDKMYASLKDFKKQIADIRQQPNKQAKQYLKTQMDEMRKCKCIHTISIGYSQFQGVIVPPEIANEVFHLIYKYASE